MTGRSPKPQPPRPQSRLWKAPNGTTYNVVLTGAPLHMAGRGTRAIVTFVDLEDTHHQIVRRAPEGLVLDQMTDDELVAMLLGSSGRG
jgi:hypothetical protein